MNRKKVLLVLLVLFLGFWMFQDPHGFAKATQSAFSNTWEGLTTVFRGLIRFFTELDR